MQWRRQDLVRGGTRLVFPKIYVELSVKRMGSGGGQSGSCSSPWCGFGAKLPEAENFLYVTVNSAH